MKLRLRGNSLRLRLTRQEVCRIAEGGAVEETVIFQAGPQGSLGYRLRSGDVANATLDGALIEVTVAAAAARAWAAGKEEGLYFETASGLKVAVEKDFKCLAPRAGEDDSDAYEHPGGSSPCSMPPLD